jgi:hypothetical protein
MKKVILKNLVILSFAFCATILIGNNVMAQMEPVGPTPVDKEDKALPDDEEGGSSTCNMHVTCGGDVCVVTNAHRGWFSIDCKKRCDYTCSYIKLL